MSKTMTSEDLLNLLIQETGNKISALDEEALMRVSDRINSEYLNAFIPSHKHIERGSTYEVIATGLLQNATNHTFKEGDALVAYKDEGGIAWFRHEPEFKDGRFSKLKG